MCQMYLTSVFRGCDRRTEKGFIPWVSIIYKSSAVVENKRRRQTDPNKL